MSLSSNSGQPFAARTASRPGDSDAAVTAGRAWLSLPTGHLVAADPIALGFGDLPLPFAQTVPPGRYPVHLLIEHGYVASARVVIRDEPATAWELTVPEGHVPGELDPNNSGYEVESGIGCLTDEQIFRRLCADGAGKWQQDLVLGVVDRPAIAGVLAAATAFILGFPVLRLRGDYYAIVTLGFGEIVRLVLINWTSLTNGPNGISDIPRPTLFGLEFTPIPVLHGKSTVLGFRFGNAAYLTDHSEIPDESKKLLEGLDVLFLDALRHRPRAQRRHRARPSALPGADASAGAAPASHR